ncbi:MAG: TonB-dependent receptor [Gemmatimonadota bacterium]|nr:TonB-dependent receptor [Gemmatimonadota bacterium]
MKIVLGIALGASLLAPFPALRAQQGGSAIVGVVTDGERAIPFVRVAVVELTRSTVTAADGSYRIAAVPPGTYSVNFIRLGFAPVMKRVTISGQEVGLNVAMVASRVELPPVQSTASTYATTAFMAPQPTTELEGTALRTSQGASVGATLEGLAGVRSLSMTTGIGKPVIRGLTSTRVVVLDNGHRLETQQWGSDHSPNVETATANRIEVLRGPASVLYGSDALGGVINIVKPPLPDAIGQSPFYRGRLAATFLSNPRSPDITVGAEAAVSGWGVRGSLATRASGDMITPVAVMRNTSNRATNIEATAGRRGNWGSVELAAVTREERIEVYEDPVLFPSFSGFQRIAEERYSLKSSLLGGFGRMEIMAGAERNRRREYDDEQARYVALGLLSTTLIGHANYHHLPVGGMAGTIGLSLLRSDFEKFGRETLIPSSSVRNLGAYLFEQRELGRWKLSAGARYDFRGLTADRDTVLKIERQTRRWGAATGNVGALYRLTEPVSLVLNVGSGFRAPSNADLFANGYHEGTRAFERGDPDLGVEKSLNVDLAVRAAASTFTVELAGFVNTIRDYIYLKPAGTLDTLDHAQGNARLSGFELAGAFHPTDYLSFRGTADYVRGQNTTLNLPLTFIPPMRGTLRATVQPAALRKLKSPYVAITAEAVGAQRRLDPGDVGTSGYTLFHGGAGFSIGSGAKVRSLDISVRNAFDKRYRNFMSQYKTIAHGQGRSVAVRLNFEM